MKINYSIGIVNNKYICELFGDGPYIHLFDITEDNLVNNPPKIFLQDDMDELAYEMDMYDENSGKKFSSLDVIFREVTMDV